MKVHGKLYGVGFCVVGEVVVNVAVHDVAVVRVLLAERQMQDVRSDEKQDVTQ